MQVVVLFIPSFSWTSVAAPYTIPVRCVGNLQVLCLNNKSTHTRILVQRAVGYFDFL